MATHTPIPWFYEQQPWVKACEWGEAMVRVQAEDAARKAAG
jgi:hypothetical protein